jgi:hypothetical protein
MSKEAMTLALEALKGYRRELNDGQPCDAEKALEEALKQKQGEPVAWGVIASNTGRLCQVELDFAEVEDLSPKWVMPLYTTPQQRTWVGLTDLERAEITKLKWWDWEDSFDVDGFTRAVEAKLKEKNT